MNQMLWQFQHGKDMDGKGMAKTLQEHGKNMAQTWQEHGKDMARAWQRHGKSMAKHCSNMAKSWGRDWVHSKSETRSRCNSTLGSLLLKL